MMNLSSLQNEEKLFLRRLEDLFDIGGGARFSSFLTSRQLDIAEAYAHQTAAGDYMLYGGYPDAERKMLGVFPLHIVPDACRFPLKAVTLAYPTSFRLSHRDFLGACLGLLVTRESIGDIVIADGSAVIFALDTVANVLLEELKKVGSVGVRCAEGLAGELVRADQFESLRGTVHSARIDSLVSLLTGLSREKSAVLIKAERVQRNHTPALSISGEFAPGDTVSIRGYGKYIVDNIGNPTKKGRLPVDCRKYK